MGVNIHAGNGIGGDSSGSGKGGDAKGGDLSNVRISDTGINDDLPSLPSKGKKGFQGLRSLYWSVLGAVATMLMGTAGLFVINGRFCEWVQSWLE